MHNYLTFTFATLRTGFVRAGHTPAITQSRRTMTTTVVKLRAILFDLDGT